MNYCYGRVEISAKFHISLLIHSVFLFFYYPLPMEQTQQHQKKHFSEEATLDKVEKKIDHNMEKIMNKGFVQKFLNLKIVKDILGAHFVNDINHKLQPYLKTIFTIVGRISLIT
jgi:hypothetical protein